MRDTYPMSRRRCTTAKMFSGRQGGPKPSKNGRQSQGRSSAVHRAEESHSDELPKAEAVVPDWVAEASPDDFGEERTAWGLKRYFKLNLALAGINLLVAGTTLGALWSRLEKQPEPSAALIHPMAQPKPVPAAPPAPTITPLPSPTPLPPAPVGEPSASPPGALSPPPGSPPSSSSKREVLASVPKTRRAPARPHANPPAFNATKAEEDEAVVLNSVVERW